MSFIAAAVITGVAGLGAAYIGSRGRKGGDLPSYNLPDFPEDPFAQKAQETLFPFGQRLLEGDIPDYYKPIGEFGGELFESVLGLGKRDIETAGIETAARLGQRGGNVPVGVAREVSDFTRKARFDDYTRALQGRGFFLGAGADITAGVGQRGLTAQAQRSQYEISRGNLALGYAGLSTELGIARETALGEGIGSGISGLANLYAKYQLGRVDVPQTPYDPGIMTV